MSKIKNRVIGFLSVIFIIAGIITVMFSDMEVRAANRLEMPLITLKRINRGTGVKIIINKNINADGYYIYISNTQNAYSSYMRNGGDYYRHIGTIDQNGTKQRTFTIKGLPKGTYSIKVAAYQKDNEGAIDWDTFTYGNEETVKIKSAKAVTVKEKDYDFSKVKVGDIIKFGSYEQDDNMLNGKEDIEWIVISKNKKRMLVVSKYTLDCLPYNNESESTSWETCSLRKWLNKYFYKTAFTAKEKSMIQKTKLSNKGDSATGTISGRNTKDRVFLLSLSEINSMKEKLKAKFGGVEEALKCSPTAYALVQSNSYYDGDYPYFKTQTGGDWWWLRSIGSQNYQAGFVWPWGNVSPYGYSVANDHIGVRPAIYIKL